MNEDLRERVLKHKYTNMSLQKKPDFSQHTHNQALELVIKNGSKRLISLYELAAFCIDGLDGKLNNFQAELFETLRERNLPIFVSIAAQNGGNKIKFFEDVSGLVFSRDRYEPVNMSSPKCYYFDLKLPSQKAVSLSDVNKKCREIIMYMFGQEFQRLPEEIRQDASMFVPNHNVVVPLSVRLQPFNIGYERRAVAIGVQRSYE